MRTGIFHSKQLGSSSNHPNSSVDTSNDSSVPSGEAGELRGAPRRPQGCVAAGGLRGRRGVKGRCPAASLPGCGAANPGIKTNT